MSYDLLLRSPLCYTRLLCSCSDDLAFENLGSPVEFTSQAPQDFGMCTRMRNICLAFNAAFIEHGLCCVNLESRNLKWRRSLRGLSVHFIFTNEDSEAVLE